MPLSDMSEWEWEEFRRLMTEMNRESTRRDLQEVSGASPLEDARIEWAISNYRPIHIKGDVEFALVLSEKSADDFRELRSDALLMFAQFNAASEPPDLAPIHNRIYDLIGRVLVTADPPHTPAGRELLYEEVPAVTVFDVFRRICELISRWEEPPPPPPPTVRVNLRDLE